jgi:hypothetical protein
MTTDSIDALAADIECLEDEVADLTDHLHIYKLRFAEVRLLQDRAKEILADMYLDLDGARTFTEVRQLLEDLCEK